MKKTVRCILYAPPENARKNVLNECPLLQEVGWRTATLADIATTTITSPRQSASQPAVYLIRHGLIGERRPIAARLAHVVRHGERARLQLVGAEQHLREEAGGRVPGDVAVQGPDARVLAGVELHDDVAAARHHLDVAAHRVARVERRRLGLRVVARPRRQHVHVQAVGVDRVGAA